MVSAHSQNAARHAGHRFPRGARVYDHETGQEGTVEKSAIAHGVAAPVAGAQATAGLFTLAEPVMNESVAVRLDDGSIVERPAAELVGLPAALPTIPADFAPPNPR